MLFDTSPRFVVCGRFRNEVYRLQSENMVTESSVSELMSVLDAVAHGMLVRDHEGHVVLESTGRKMGGATLIVSASFRATITETSLESGCGCDFCVRLLGDQHSPGGDRA